MIDRIMEEKRREVEALGSATFGARQRPVRRLVFQGPVNIIAELKRRSPSAGNIGEIDEGRIAAYNRYARAISVLTDATFFGGSYEFLAEVTHKTELPVLCKDFVIDRVQIDRAYAAGADLVLLIARILTGAQLGALYAHARGLGLSCLVEVHGKDELDKLAGIEPALVGVNARDLDSLEIDLERAAGILACVKAQVKVAESGIKSRQDIERLREAGADCFLIGEMLMRSHDPASVFEELLHG